MASSLALLLAKTRLESIAPLNVIARSVLQRRSAARHCPAGEATERRRGLLARVRDIRIRDRPQRGWFATRGSESRAPAFPGWPPAHRARAPRERRRARATETRARRRDSARPGPAPGGSRGAPWTGRAAGRAPPASRRRRTARRRTA